MQVGSVSFAGTSEAFQEMIKKPQIYVATQTPAASAEISGQKKEHKGLKVASVIVLAAAAAAAGLVAGKHFNLFDKIPSEKIADALNNAGGAIINGVKDVKDKAIAGFERVKDKLSKPAEQA